MKGVMIVMGGLVALSSGVARAEGEDGGGPFTAGKVQVQAEIQYGAIVERTLDLAGPTVGLEVGGTLGFGLYLGASFDWAFLGEDPATTFAATDGDAWYLAAAIGYDVALGSRVVLRPKVVIGASSPLTEECVDFDCDPEANHMIVGPAVEALFDLGPVFVSAEARVDLDLDSAYKSLFTAGLGIGAAF